MPRSPRLGVLFILVSLLIPSAVTSAETRNSDVIVEVRTPTFTLHEGGVDVPGYEQNDVLGAPALPFYPALIELPSRGTWEISYSSAASRELPGQHAVGAVPVPSPISFTPDALFSELTPETVPLVDRPDRGIYRSDAYYPTALVVEGQEQCRRGARLLALKVFPFQYNPVSGRLLYHPEIRVRVRIVDSEQAGPCTQRPESLSPVAAPAAVAAERSILRVRTSQTGLHRLTYDDLQAAGVTVSNINPASLAMALLGQTVRIQVLGEEDGSFDPGDLIIFYAEPYTGRWMTSNVYQLSYGTDAGPAESRMGLRETAKTDSEPVVSSVTQELLINRDVAYYADYHLPLEADHFFDNYLWANPSAPTDTETYTLELDDPLLDSGAVLIEGLIYGGKSEALNQGQSFDVALNGQSLGRHQWLGHVPYKFAAEVPAPSLTGPPYNLVVTVATSQLPALSDYWIYPDWFKVTYPARAEAEADHINILQLNTSALAAQVQVSGFTAADVRVYDVRDPKAPVQLETFTTTPAGLTYTVDFWDAWTAEQADRRYALASSLGLLAPVAVEVDVPTQWRSTAHSYDYIAIVHPALAEAVQPLLQHRRAEGLDVAQVFVQDLYDEFNYGQLHQKAIRDFLTYAYNSWNQGGEPPRYVLLVGDGHPDFKGVLGTPVPNLIPPFLIDIDPWIGETGADNRFVSIDGETDYLPEMAIGRIPAWTASDVQNVTAKIVAYESAAGEPDEPWQERVVFVADDDQNAAGNFHALSDDILLNWLPEGYEGQTVYFNPNNLPAGVGYTSPSAMKAEITKAFNDGALMLQWFGHGSRFRWGSVDNMWKVYYAAELLPNTHLPFTVSYSCWSGYYINLFKYLNGGPAHYQSLGETQLLQAGRGSIADFSPSGQHVGSALAILNRGVVKSLLTDRIARVGDAVDAAKQYYYAQSGSWHDVIDTSILFADPALQLRLPRVPTAAPEAPFISVSVINGDDARLRWDHVLEADYYELYRGTSPYFEPGAVVGDRILDLDAGPFGEGSVVQPIDDGKDDYAADGVLPVAEPVIGDVGTNYFWVVRSRNAGGEASGNSNRVGEFDFALVPGQ